MQNIGLGGVLSHLVRYKCTGLVTSERWKSKKAMKIADLQAATDVSRQALLNHKVYSQLAQPEALKRFMELHVYAVWDFMSLLKALQQDLTCVSIPWVPAADGVAARMINQIVLEEESDIGADGRPASHFELYLQAMQQVGAETDRIMSLIGDLNSGEDYERSLDRREVPMAAREFMKVTFEIIESGHLPSIASAFTIGRENLVPGLFRGIIVGLNESGKVQSDRFLYYLDRHIGLDEGEHGPLAFQILERLCGDVPESWELAKLAGLTALEARLKLWDAISESIVAI